MFAYRYEYFPAAPPGLSENPGTEYHEPMWKCVNVSRRIAGRNHWATETVEIPGILPDEPLTPKMAVQAARILYGPDFPPVWVIGNDGWGFALYENSYNKLVARIDYDKE